MAPGTEGPSLLVDTFLSGQFGHKKRWNEIANLAKNGKLVPCWFGWFVWFGWFCLVGLVSRCFYIV